MAKKTPFHAIHQKEGGKLVEFAGFEMPVQYKGIKVEHAAVRNDVGVFDVSHMGEFYIHGQEALDLVQHISVNDASKLVPGKAQYTCMCYEDGGIVDDMIVYKLFEEDHDIILYTSPDEIEDKIKWWSTHPEERKKLALKGMKKVRENHLISHRVNRMLQYLKENFCI